MQRISLIFLCVTSALFATLLQAQSPALWAFYHNTPRSETTVKFTIPGFLPKIGALFIQEENTRQIVRKMGKTRFFIIENGANTISDNETKRLIQRLHREGFQDYLTVKDKSDNIRFMVREKRSKIRGVVMLVKSDGNFVLMSAKCRLSIEQISQLINEHSDEIVDKVKAQKENR
jgi:hypothetical protein